MSVSTATAPSAVVVALSAAIDGLSEVDVAGLGPAVGDHVRALVAARHRLDGELEQAIAAYDAGGYGELDGARTTAAWLRGRTLMAPAEASHRVKTARYLRELPETAAALRAGTISFEHARAVAMLAADTDVEATRSVEAQLVEVAQLTDPVRFARELRIIRDNYRPTPTPRSEQTAYARRRFSLAESLEGSFSLGGWLTDEGGATLKAALDPLAAPVPGDTRTPTQRYADALVELARRHLTRADAPERHGTRPNLIVITEVGPDDDPQPREGTPSSDGVRLVRGRLVGGGTLSSVALERLACDATISRVLLRPPGEILDLGRAARVVSPAQWRALVVRDGGCVIPGHDCSPVATEAHHLKSWLRGGTTDLAGLALVCTYGHHLIHDQGWRLYLRDSDRRWILQRPDGTDIEGAVIGETGNNLHGATQAILNGPRGPCDD